MIDHPLKKKYLFNAFILFIIFPLNALLFNLLWIDCIKLFFIGVFCNLFAHFIFFIKTAYLKNISIGNFYGAIYLLVFALWAQFNYLLASFSLIPYSSASLLLSLGLVITYLIYKEKSKFKINYKISDHRIFINDLTFFTFFFVLFMCQSSFHSPLYWGEKSMDLSFISSFLRTNDLPLTDPWLSGLIPHYYVMGYYLISIFPKIVSLEASISYHVCLSLLFAFNLWIIKDILALFLNKKLRSSFYPWGLSFLTLMIPNLKSLFLFVQKIAHFQLGFNFSEFWSLTRIYPNSMFAEYPSWSYLFADLHPHVISYLFLALFLFWIFFYFKKFKFIAQNYNRHLTFILICSFCLGLIGVINIWDYLFTSGILLFFVIYYVSRTKDIKYFWALCFYPLSLILFFSQLYYQMGGIPLRFGFRTGQVESISEMLFQFGGPLLFLIILSSSLIFKKTSKVSNNYQFLISLFIPVFVLLSLCHFFYLMDQVNTIFKFHTSSYYFLSIVITLLFISLFKNKSQKYFSKILIFLFLLFNFSNLSSLLTQIRVEYLPVQWGTKTLEGKNFITTIDPEFYQMINYFKKFILGRPNIIEAYGESFDHERNMVSTYTGSSAFIGWRGHLKIRGANQRTLLIRRDIVDQIYRSPDALLCYNLAKENNIDFIVTSRAENDVYGRKVDLKFKTFHDIFPRIICFGDACLFGVKGNYEKYLGRSI